MKINSLTLMAFSVVAFFSVSCNSTESGKAESAMREIYEGSLAYQDKPTNYNQQFLQNQPDSDALQFWEVFTIYLKLVGETKALYFIDSLVEELGLTTIIVSPWGSALVEDSVIRKYLTNPDVQTSALLQLNFGSPPQEAKILVQRKLNYSGTWPRRSPDDFTSPHALQIIRSFRR